MLFLYQNNPFSSDFYYLKVMIVNVDMEMYDKTKDATPIYPVPYNYLPF